MADSWNSQEGGDWGLSKKTQSWYNEVADFPSSNVGSFAGGYLNGKAVGHYTQVVWAESQKVGCGVIYYKDTNPNFAQYPYRKVQISNETFIKLFIFNSISVFGM